MKKSLSEDVMDLRGSGWAEWRSRNGIGKFTSAHGILLTVLLIAAAVLGTAFVNGEEKPPAISVDDFVHSLDKDGDGEIGREEATKFLAELETSEEQMEKEEMEGTLETAGKSDVSMAALMNHHKVDDNFNYGGNAISVAEMTDHLEHMLTGDRVVEWVKHGLRLPQYADTFKENSIDGLDFPTLISDNGAALRDDLGVTSPLHRTKIQAAVMRQVFGLGQVPDPPESLLCSSMVGGIFLNWKPPAKLGTPPLHKFLIKRRTLNPSGMKGIWKELGDTGEESWWDTRNLEPGVEYEYRVQSWGGHGPSAWTNVTGCKMLSSLVAGVETEIEKGAICSDPGEVSNFQQLAATNGKEWGARARSAEALAKQDRISVVHPSAGVRAGSDGGVGAGAGAAGAAGAVGAAGTAGVTEDELLGSGSSAVLSSSPYGQGKQEEGTMFGYMWSVNGGILLLGLLSRSSFLFRAASSVSAALHQLLLQALPSPQSSSPAMRRLSHSLHLLVSAVQALCMAVLGALGFISHFETVEEHLSLGESNPPQSTPSTSGSSSDILFEGNPSSIPVIHRNPSGGSLNSSGLDRHGTITSSGTSGACDAPSINEGCSEAGTRASSEKLESAPAPPGKPKIVEKPAKNRCNATDCQVHFSGFVGVWENLRKHYCKDCQSWYCARHTRITSHSTLFCRFDSQCRCFSCFSRLPATTQFYLESINARQPEKAKKANGALTEADRNSNKPGAVWGSQSKNDRAGGPEGGDGKSLERRNSEKQEQMYPSLIVHVPQEPLQSPMHAPDAKSKTPSPGLVPRSKSDAGLASAISNGDFSPLGEQGKGGNSVMKQSSAKRKVMKHYMSTPAAANFSEASTAKPEQEGKWLKTVFSSLAGGAKDVTADAERNEDITRGGEDQRPMASHDGLSSISEHGRELEVQGVLDAACERSFCKSDGGVSGGLDTLSRKERSNPDLKHVGPISSGEQPFDEREADKCGSSVPESTASTCVLGGSLSSGGSSASRQASFGRSRSLRAECTNSFRRDKVPGALTPSPRDEVSALLRQRCNSMENLAGLDKLHEGVEEDEQVQPISGKVEQGRRQLSSIKGALRKSLNHITTILPGGSPKLDDLTRPKKKESFFKAQIDIPRVKTSRHKAAE